MDIDRAPAYRGMPYGGVFINYRAVDQPLAAAAIYDALARRFGADRVFRDCASMQAGEHYPAAIRAALESATVLVAVVGPQWLTLTEPRTSNRLIDRDHDWVRLEIARALRRRIPVIPVMLKHTPKDAARLTPAELPEDIRQLAKLQTFEFSQRRFGEDLDRLAHRLLQLEPALAIRRSNVITLNNGTAEDPPDAFSELVEAFLEAPYVRDEGDRRLLLNLIRPEIATAVPGHSSARLHVIALLRTCLQYKDGLANVIDAARTLGMDAGHAQYLRTLADRLLSSSMDRS
jgi:Effector-associated domain 2/TIR domain